MRTVLAPLRFALGLALTLPPLFLPYRLRTRYFQGIAAAVHFPYSLFGRLAGILLRSLQER